MEKQAKNNTLGKILSLKEGLFRSRNIFLLLMLILGIILMSAGSMLNLAPKAEQMPALPELPALPGEPEDEMARALEGILEHIDGISKVRVFITYTSGKEGVYALSGDESSRSTLEQDREGGTRQIDETTRSQNQVILRDGGGGEKALLLKEKMPEIKGVLVVAKGAEDSRLRLKVMRAVQSVLNLPLHRIAFLPYGN